SAFAVSSQPIISSSTFGVVTYTMTSGSVRTQISGSGIGVSSTNMSSNTLTVIRAVYTAATGSIIQLGNNTEVNFTTNSNVTTNVRIGTNSVSAAANVTYKGVYVFPSASVDDTEVKTYLAWRWGVTL